ncbi:hypothetical protein [Agrobacterium salinitolerans]|uniref:hypothetical protein n=1 Tax=Agrobacterium salinitolerans TaxID=1183413 RepID=UPI00157195D1|nr:hypothetical protein [Agrobacterium salinitolerans]NTA35984.1 hypothetical protein [Agrobacterium salinitolerans]
MTIDTKKLRATILADAHDLRVRDEQSICILAIGRIAQATLVGELERMAADGAPAAEIDSYRAERGEQLGNWMKIECERARMRTVVREEVARCIG